MPAVKSFASCNQIVDRNLIVEVECQEQHRLKPLSDGTSGVYVTLRQHLDLITTYVSSSLNGSAEQEDDNMFGKTDGFGDDDGFGLGLDEDEYGDEDDGSSTDESGGPGSNQKESSSLVEDAGSFLIIQSKPYAYITEIISTSPEQILRRESLVFQHNYHVGSTTTASPNDYKQATNALHKFCQAVKVGRSHYTFTDFHWKTIHLPLSLSSFLFLHRFIMQTATYFFYKAIQ